jgi:AcrR family transcriptional regulator
MAQNAGMGRPKKFSREGVLEKAIPVFWKNGFAHTSLPDLELATGVNKSGLYSEFESKEDLFLASLQHYFTSRGGQELLTQAPLGWSNIENFLQICQSCGDGQKGCFSVNSMRELATLPPEAHAIVTKARAHLKRLLIQNIRAEQTTVDAGTLSDMVFVFFSGICIEQNLDTGKEATTRKINHFMKVLRAL